MSDSIPTTTILAKRLCLVCARDGVEKPVQEHECEHEHFVSTLRLLELCEEENDKDYLHIN